MHIALALALGLTLSTHDKQIEHLPQVVSAAVTARYPKAKIVAFELDEGTYEVRLDLLPGRTELIVSADGKITAEEREIQVKELPEPVAKAIAASKYAAATMRRVERVIVAGKPDTFELIVVVDKSKRELVFSSDGALIKDEPKQKKDLIKDPIKKD